MTWRVPAAALALGLVFGGMAGWHLHTPPPAPAVHAVEASREVAQLAQRVEESGSTTTITDFAPVDPRCPVQIVPGPERLVPGPVREGAPVFVQGPPVPGPERIVRQTVIVKGPSTTDTKAETATEHHAELVLTPPPVLPPAGWAATLGLQLLPDKRLELGLERRLFGPLWARVWLLQPAAIEPPAVGVGLRVEW